MEYSSYFPTKQQFLESPEKADIIPVIRKIVADLDTPLTLYAKVAQGQDDIFLFESMEGGEKWGRYSFIGFDPLVKFSSSGRRVTVDLCDRGAQEIHDDVNPIEILRSIVDGFEVAGIDDLPRFCGGAVGYMGYDMVRFMEELPDRHEPLAFPDSLFMIPRLLLVYDNLKQVVSVICWCHVTEESNRDTLYDDAVTTINGIVERLKAPLPADAFVNQPQSGPPHCFTSNMDRETYYNMVERGREYILAGDVFQVVLSQRFHTKTWLTPMSLYRALRHINPSPYLYFMKWGDLVQVGSSPEILVRKDGQDIELRPIAGTRKRGATPAEDRALEEDLHADPKENAEHLMLVDLGRNDVGRVAVHGSVEVRELAIVERYSHVMHLVSDVHGIIADDKDQFDVMTACFPAGTVSGAPKIRAMEIIDELEPERRGPYAGAVGYFGFSGNMDFCITIRTYVISGDDMWVQAGGGIVADSDPEKEFDETINKSMALRKAVELAEKGL